MAQLSLLVHEGQTAVNSVHHIMTDWSAAAALSPIPGSKLRKSLWNKTHLGKYLFQKLPSGNWYHSISTSITHHLKSSLSSQQAICNLYTELSLLLGDTETEVFVLYWLFYCDECGLFLHSLFILQYSSVLCWSVHLYGYAPLHSTCTWVVLLADLPGSIPKFWLC